MKNQNKSSRKHHTFLPAVCSTLSAVILFLVAAICFPMTVPRMFGYDVYTVVSGSMEPAIPVGSAIFLERAMSEEIAVGDVIAFYRGEAVITHRVTENHTVTGEFITKGDANQEEDMTPAAYESLIGRVALSVPSIGYILAACSGTAGKIYLACGVAAAILLWLAGGFLQRE